MILSDPRFLYIILVLPALFGITLVGEGINKVVQHETYGILNIFFGLLFLAVVGFVVYFFSSFIS
jgi:hypothetical protein